MGALTADRVPPQQLLRGPDRLGQGIPPLGESPLGLGVDWPRRLRKLTEPTHKNYS